MSIDPIELTLSHALNGSRNPVHTHGPFPIMSYGENLGNNYTNTPSLFLVPINDSNHSASSSTSGTWLANLKLAILTHKHADGTPCSNVLEHAALADSEEDKSFSATHTRLVQHILAPERQCCMKLEAENTDLLATHANYRPGFNSAGVLATWNVSGWLDVPSYITKHASLCTLPEIISFSGNACGSQLLPANDVELSALVSQSNEPGNFCALFRLHDSMGLGLILEGLNRELRISTTPIPSIIPKLLRTSPTPTSDEDYALFTWVHYDNLGHLGIILTDDGHIQLDSVRVLWPLLYSSILKNKGISVNPSSHILRCPTELSHDVEGIAHHLANCNVTETTVNHLFHWGMQYCLDVQDLLSIPESRRHELTTIYKYGRIRSLFFPIHTDCLSDTYIKPSHINPYQVMEYWRCQFVHAHWKDTNSVPSPDFKVLVHHVPRASLSAIPVSVAGLSLSKTGNATLPPSSTSGVLSGSTSATSSETPTSETSNMQSVSATASSASLVVKTDNPDMDMQENSNDCATNIDAMEDVE
ncbi:hypothetical protein L218DRAFT_947453 [Marasmius fiardii PR-910]|nr:hypothetical protein L218DRAFT_947453 [Marasmius fiardii PR-910]